MMQEGTPANIDVRATGRRNSRPQRARRRCAGDHRRGADGHRTSAIFPIEELQADHPGHVCRPGGSPILITKFRRAFAAFAGAFAAPGRHADRSRAHLHAGGTAEPEACGARETLRGARSRAEQSVRRGAPFGRHSARVSGAIARSGPSFFDRSRRLRCCSPSARKKFALAQAGAISRTNLRASSAKKPFRAGLKARNVKDAWQLGPLLAEANLTDAQSGNVRERSREHRSARNSRALPRCWKWIASPTSSTTAPRASPTSSGRSRNIPTWIRRPCRKWTSPRAWTPR